MSTVLLKRRINAAHLSGGTSSDVIYDSIQNIINQKRLGGLVLDYGAGTGILIRRLVSMRCFREAHAADLIPRPGDISQNVRWIPSDLNASLPVSDSAYDLVVAAEVIEHLENPRFTVREIFRLLRPGGSAIVSTPNNEHVRSVLSLILRGHFAAFVGSNYPAHITSLLRCDLERILLETGFALPNFEYTHNGSIPCTTVTWQQLSMGFLKGKLFSDNIIAVAVKPKTA